MNTLNTLRKPYWAFFLAIIMLSISCTSSTDVTFDKRSFDYSTYIASKEQASDLQLLSKEQILILESNKKGGTKTVLDYINEPFYPVAVLQPEALTYFYYNTEDLKRIGLENKFFTKLDIELLDQFGENVEEHNIEYALTEFEIKVLSLDISKEEFNKYNYFANLVKMTKI